MTGRRIIGTLCQYAGTAAILLAVAVGACAAVPRLAGLLPYAVVSGSMEPAIPTGALAYARPCEASGIVSGDIVAFYDRSGIVVIHRAVENDLTSGEVVTKGDANAMPDPVPVPYGNIIGTVHGSVPLAGYAVMYGRVWICLVAAGGAMLHAVGSRVKKEY